MNRMPEIYGEDLEKLIESLGCNKRNQIGSHSVYWSIYTGDFFVVPIYKNERLDSRTFEHIVWNLGTTEEGFWTMWNQFKS